MKPLNLEVWQMFDMMRIGKRIAKLRREQNMTQMELSDRIGISHQAVSKWERGESMPDISTLPLLADIYGISVDSLLESNGDQDACQVKVLKSILDNTAEDAIEDGSITLQDIGHIAPILKPAQLDSMMKHFENVSIGELCGIAPFISTEVLDGLAIKVFEIKGISELCGIAPFISTEVLDSLAKKASEVEGISELCGIAPFVSKDVLDGLAIKVSEVEGISELCGIAPFISKDVLDTLAMKTAEANGIGELCGIAPFISKEVLDGLAIKAFSDGNIGELCQIAPFLSNNVSKRMSTKQPI
jgi:transcriptional regulator with XRE-family HTH domain